jgi:hypothetical protein
LLWILLVVALAIVAASAFRLPIAQAFTDLAGLRPSYEGLEFRNVRTETRRARTGKTLVVEGQIVNRAGRELLLPAVGLTLRANGTDVFEWAVEPSATIISTDQTIGFRSTVAPPDADDGEVVLRFVDRTAGIIGRP